MALRTSQRMRIGATCPISKIERSISRLFTNREGSPDVILWCQRLHRGPQTAGIRVSRMNGDATGGREAHTIRIKCINSVLMNSFPRGLIVRFSKEGSPAQRTTRYYCATLLNYTSSAIKQTSYKYCRLHEARILLN